VEKGGTMRLGSYPCVIADEDSRMYQAYRSHRIDERHRHRYEFNNAFRDELTAAGLVISGTSPDGRLVETIEIPGCDFNVGVQFHPEFKSRPNRPHPLFLGLVGAALSNTGTTEDNTIQKK
jgi:CTP synthase